MHNNINISQTLKKAPRNEHGRIIPTRELLRMILADDDAIGHHLAWCVCDDYWMRPGYDDTRRGSRRRSEFDLDGSEEDDLAEFIENKFGFARIPAVYQESMLRQAILDVIGRD